jgi:hypothetical protein
VLHPSEVPAQSDVYVGLAPIISRSVVRRIQSAGALYHEVPLNLHANTPRAF